MEDKNLHELIDEWCNQKKIHRWEGSSGVRNFQRLCETLGYRNGAFIGYDHAIENFLADNPGAIEALIEWIGDRDEWKEDIASELSEEDEEEDE